MAAIDDGRLTQEMIDRWLVEIEGWGNQHIYLYDPLPIGFAKIKSKIRASKYAQLLDRPISYDFSDSLALTTINLASQFLSAVWHIGNSGWVRTKTKDFQEEEGVDRFEYRAYRERFDRSVVRFEWHFSNPYCAIRFNCLTKVTFTRKLSRRFLQISQKSVC